MQIYCCSHCIISVLLVWRSILWIVTNLLLIIPLIPQRMTFNNCRFCFCCSISRLPPEDQDLPQSDIVYLSKLCTFWANDIYSLCCSSLVCCDWAYTKHCIQLLDSFFSQLQKSNEWKCGIATYISLACMPKRVEWYASLCTSIACMLSIHGHISNQKKVWTLTPEKGKFFFFFYT